MTFATRARITIIALIAAVALAARADRHAPKPEARFVLPTPSTNQSNTPLHIPDFLPSIPDAPSVHAPALCETPDGKLFALWWGGSREGGKDVRIFLSQRDGSTWTEPRAIMSRDQTARELLRPVRRIGNAIIYSPAPQTLRVIFVTTSFGGWSTSSLNHIVSADNGKTWSRAERLHLSPILNISELVRCPPIALDDGSFLLPIYHELAGKFPETVWLREQKNGRLAARKQKSFGGRKAFQPALAPLTPTQALMALRDPKGYNLYTTWTTDAGLTFSQPTRSGLPNPDSGVALLALPNNRVLLAYNDTSRATLSLAISTDDGVTWRHAKTVIKDVGEASYPALQLTRDGNIHLAYTWNRERIRHHVFTYEWLDQ